MDHADKQKPLPQVPPRMGLGLSVEAKKHRDRLFKTLLPLVSATPLEVNVNQLSWVLDHQFTVALEGEGRLTPQNKLVVLLAFDENDEETRISFRPSEFNFESDEVVYGQHPSSDEDDKDNEVIGGTFHISRRISDDQLPWNLILKLALYIQLSMTLEQSFWTHLGAPGETEPKQDDKPPEPERQPESLVEDDKDQQKDKRSSFGLLSFLKAKAIGKRNTKKPVLFPDSTPTPHATTIPDPVEEPMPLLTTSPSVTFPPPPVMDSSSDAKSALEIFLSHQSLSVLSIDEEQHPRTETWRYYADDDVSLAEKIRQLSEQPRGQVYLHANVRLAITVTPAPAFENEEQQDIFSLNGNPVTPATSLLSFAKFIELLIYSTDINSDLDFNFGGKVIRFEVERNAVELWNVVGPRTLAENGPGDSVAIDQTKARLSLASTLDELEETEEKRILRKEIKVFWEGVSDLLDSLEEKLAIQSQLTLLAQNKSKKLPRLPSEDDAYEGYLFDDEEEDEDANVTETEEGSRAPTPTPGLPRQSDGYFSLTSSSKSSSSPGSTSSSEGSGSRTPTIPPSPSASIGSDAPPLPSSDQILATLRQTFTTAEQQLYSKLSKLASAPPTDSHFSSSTASSSSTAKTVKGSVNLNAVRREFLRMGLGAEERIAKVWDVYLRLGYSDHQTNLFASEHTPASHSDSGSSRQASTLGRMIGRKKKKNKEQEKEKEQLFRTLLESRKPYWFSPPSKSKQAQAQDVRTYLLPPFGNFILQDGDWGSFVAFGMSTREYLKQVDLSRKDIEEGELSPVPTPVPTSKDTTENPDDAKSASSSFFSTIFNPSSAFSSSTSTSSTSSYAPSETTVLGSSGEVVTWPPPPLPDFRCSVTRKSTEEVLAAADEGFSLLGVLSLPSLPLTPTSQRQARVKDGSTSTHSENDDDERISSVGPGQDGKERSPSPPSAWIRRSGIKTGITPIVHEGQALAVADNGDDPLLLIAGDEEDIFNPTVDSIAAPLVIPSTTSSEISTVPSLVSPPSTAGTSSTFNTLTSGFSQAMKFVLANAPELRPVSPFSSPNSRKTGQVTRRPHIQYTFYFLPQQPSSRSSKQKMKQFSLTMYYASQFHHLRSTGSSSCNLSHTSFLRSLSHTTNWIAEGGKSKSDFWKTSDGRYVVKSLVNSLWGVRDLGVLVGIGERWFEYLNPKSQSEHPGATVLAKLLGFYTIEIRNVVDGGGSSGELEKKVDLLVMENLFFGRNIERMFDLKGIIGRRRILEDKQKENPPQTLFDAEWNDNQQNLSTAILIRPETRKLLLEAITNDAAFLAHSNIMDYSLLLGLDREKKEIVCGLVDFIGSYTLAKTLEYRAKQGLVLNSISSAASGGKKKEVTVIPPGEYQERFVKAMESYFIACPDKWSNRPEHCDLDQLGNVL